MSNLPVKFVPDVADLVRVREDHPQLRHYQNYRGERDTYRVAAWLKSWTPPVRPAPPAGSPMAVFSNLLETLLDESNREFEVAGKRTRLVFCTREEAEFVEAVGACGQTFGIDEIEVCGRVSWSEEMIAAERSTALTLVGEVVF